MQMYMDSNPKSIQREALFSSNPERQNGKQSKTGKAKVNVNKQRVSRKNQLDNR